MYGINTFWKIRKKDGIVLSVKILIEDNLQLRVKDRDGRERVLNKDELFSSLRITKELYLKEVNYGKRS